MADDIWDIFARIGYEIMFDEKYKELQPNSIERALWRKIAYAIICEYEQHQRAHPPAFEVQS